MNNIIIHITGPCGAGKTYMGNKLQNYFKNKIVVKDLDELFDDFIQKYYRGIKEAFDETKYQNYINAFINKYKKKPIIFVGLNDNKTNYYVGYSGKIKDIYYNLHAQYKYYIDLDDNIVAKQKCKRLINHVIKNILDKSINLMIYETDDFLKIIGPYIKNQCNINEIIKMNNRWKKDYMRQGYKCLTRENIYKNILHILKSIK
jgi:hypothetical protein